MLDGIVLTETNVQDRHRPDQPTYRGLPRLAPAPRHQAARAPGVPRHGSPVSVADGQQEEVMLMIVIWVLQSWLIVCVQALL